MNFTSLVHDLNKNHAHSCSILLKFMQYLGGFHRHVAVLYLSMDPHKINFIVYPIQRMTSRRFYRKSGVILGKMFRGFGGFGMVVLHEVVMSLAMVWTAVPKAFRCFPYILRGFGKKFGGLPYIWEHFAKNVTVISLRLGIGRILVKYELCFVPNAPIMSYGNTRTGLGGQVLPQLELSSESRYERYLASEFPQTVVTRSNPYDI
jgi:hypothetical protein